MATFSDAPLHSSIEELTEIVFNKDLWRKYVAELNGKGHNNTQKASNVGETVVVLDPLPTNAIIAYTGD